MDGWMEALCAFTASCSLRNPKVRWPRQNEHKQKRIKKLYHKRPEEKRHWSEESILERMLVIFHKLELSCKWWFYNSFFVLYDLLSSTSWQFTKLLLNLLTPTTFSFQIIANCCFWQTSSSEFFVRLEQVFSLSLNFSVSHFSVFGY